MTVDLLKPQAITRTPDHVYTYNGVQYPSVTTVLKVLGATFQQASRYGANQAARAVADLIELGALMPTWEAEGREGFVKGIAASATRKRDEAAVIGTDVHALADQIARGESPTVPAHLKPHVDHYAAWWAASGWTLRASEAMLVHTVFKYGGTLDLLARDQQGRTVLADIKTGGVYKEAVLQLTAYSMAELIQTDAGLFTMPKADRFVILNVTAEGVRPVEVSVDSIEMIAWGAALDIHQWAETMKGKRL